MKFLLDNKAKVDRKLALHAATNSTITISRIIQSQLEPQGGNQAMGNTALYKAVNTGKKAEIESALKQNPSDINQQSQTRKNTPLHIAASKGDIDIVKLLIDNGADVKLENSKGETALHIAQQKGKQEIVELLTGSSAKVVSNYLPPSKKKVLPAIERVKKLILSTAR